MKYFKAGAILFCIFLVGIVAEAGLFYAGYHWGSAKYHVQNEDLRYAVDDCLVDLRAGCPALYDYAVTLEAENARLNKKLNRYKKKYQK